MYLAWHETTSWRRTAGWGFLNGKLKMESGKLLNSLCS